VFRHRNLLKTQAISFNDTADKHAVATETPLNSSVYDDKKTESYFEQAFVIEKKIGAGYFGTVYRVKNREDSQLYAVKIAREMYKGPSDRARKLEEVRKHQFLPPHSNLVRFYHSWEEKARLCQQFELCRSSLQDLGVEGRLSQSLIWSYMVDLLLALQHLHDHDLVHMDIKPENIFIGMDGICKLGDFGLMIDLTKGENDGMEGDPMYLAPEVLSGTFSKACDIFSLGVTLLELATDMDLPKGGQLWHDLRSRGPDPSLSIDLQPELRRVIQLMMTRDPERRPGVKQLLELPCVRDAVRRRNWQLLLWRSKDLVVRAALLFLPLLSLLYVFLCSLALPVKQVLAHLQSSGPRSSPHHLPSNLSSHMDCFSDDDNDLTVSSSGSSLAAPLDSSASDRMASIPSTPSCPFSVPSTPFLSSNFYSPADSDFSPGLTDLSHSPLKRPATSPGPLRARARVRSRTPATGIPLGKKLFSAGRLNVGGKVTSGSRRDSDSPDLQDSPANRDTNQNNEDSEDDLVTMRPMSLAATFDCFSDDD